MRVLLRTRGCVRVPLELQQLQAALPKKPLAPPPAPPPLPPPTTDERRAERREAVRVRALDARGLELQRESRKKLHTIAGVRWELSFQFQLTTAEELAKSVAAIEELGSWAGVASYGWVDDFEAAAGSWAATLRRLARAVDFESAAHVDRPTPESIPARALAVVLDPRSHSRSGLVRLILPWPSSDLSGVRERFLRMCDALPTLSASAGPRLHITSMLPLTASEVLSRRVFPLLLRYPALGYPLPTLHERTPFVPGFLTFIVERPGEDRDELSHALTQGPAVNVTRLRHGLVVQAGETPELGADGVPPPAFARVVQVLRPRLDLRVPHDCLPGISTEVLRGLATRLFTQRG